MTPHRANLCTRLLPTGKLKAMLLWTLREKDTQRTVPVSTMDQATPISVPWDITLEGNSTQLASTHHSVAPVKKHCRTRWEIRASTTSVRVLCSSVKAKNWWLRYDNKETLCRLQGSPITWQPRRWPIQTWIASLRSRWRKTSIWSTNLPPRSSIQERNKLYRTLTRERSWLRTWIRGCRPSWKIKMITCRGWGRALLGRKPSWISISKVS